MSTVSEKPGAVPAEGLVPLCVPEIRGNEWKYLRECLDTNWVSSVGPFVDHFERKVAARVSARCGVATVNGTAALHIALLVTGIERDDEVIVSDLTFIAPVNVIRYVGAWPVFIDSEPEYWQMDPAKLAEFLRRGCVQKNGKLINRSTGRRVRAILPVHILGHPVDFDAILEEARRYTLPVIEDATESLGATYKGRPVGSLGDIACFSFNGNKIITTGGGGMIVTANKEWAARAKYLTTQANDDPVEFIHREIGYNYRLTNIQSALGCAQLEKLDEYIAIKRRIAASYTRALENVAGITPMGEAPWASSTFWLFTVRVDPARYGMDSRRLMRKLGAAGIQSRPLWQPLHRNPIYSACPRVGGDIAEQLNKDCLSLPCSIGLSEEQQLRVIQVIAQRDLPDSNPNSF